MKDTYLRRPHLAPRPLALRRLLCRRRPVAMVMVEEALESVVQETVPVVGVVR